MEKMSKLLGSGTPEQRIASMIGRYDLRARYGDEIDSEDAVVLGRTIGTMFQGSVLIGWDTRRDSRTFSRGLIEGLEQAGAVSKPLGVVPTPIMGFAARQWGLPALVATPSHNELGYVGLKGFDSRGQLWGKEWDLLRSTLSGGRLRKAKKKQGTALIGGYQSATLRVLKREYAQMMTSIGHSSIKIAIDPRGGATSGWAKSGLQVMGVKVVAMNDECSPNFHGSSPEPTPKNISGLAKLVRSSSADLGVAFDGDGDRALFLDEKGASVSPEVIALLLHESLSNGKNMVVASSDTSRKLSRRAQVAWVPVGARNIISAMKKRKAKVGFESSSHFYLESCAYYSDAICVTGHIVRALWANGYQLSKRSSQFGRLYRANIVLRFEDKRSTLLTANALYEDWNGIKRRHIDGYVLEIEPLGGIFCRVSNTEAAIRMTLEANAPSGLRRVMSMLNRFLREHELSASTVPGQPLDS
jgi:phosphomannomutase